MTLTDPRPARTTLRRRATPGLGVGVLLAMFLLAACGPDGDADPTPTLTVEPGQPAAATTVPPVVGTGQPGSAGTSGPAVRVGAFPISDGVCTARIPASWTDDGTGKGRTAAGHRFALFGGRLADDAAWERAIDLFTDQAAGRAEATVTSDDGVVHVDYGDGGFAHRVRLGDRYCDFRLTATGGPVPADERAAAEAVLATLAPANP